MQVAVRSSEMRHVLSCGLCRHPAGIIPHLSDPAACARGNIPSSFLVVGVGRQWARDVGETAALPAVGCGVAGPGWPNGCSTTAIPM